MSARTKAKLKLDASYVVYEAARVAYLAACDEYEAASEAVGYRREYRFL